MYFKELIMTHFYVISYVLGDYTMDDIKVEVIYAPAVVESFYSKKEISELIEKKRDKNILDGIFNIIKKRTAELDALEIWHDVIEYRGIELVWKSFFNTNKNRLGVEVLYSKDNRTGMEALH